MHITTHQKSCAPPLPLPSIPVPPNQLIDLQTQEQGRIAILVRVHLGKLPLPCAEHARKRPKFNERGPSQHFLAFVYNENRREARVVDVLHSHSYVASIGALTTRTYIGA